MSDLLFSKRPHEVNAETDYLERIRKIWSEKRGRPVTDGAEEYTLAVGLVEPTFDVSKIVDGMLDGLSSVDPGFAYEWSKKWGQARIALSPDGNNQWQFVNVHSKESKKFSPIFTNELFFPSEVMYDSRSTLGNENPIQLLVNDSTPVTMEGAVLQIERMVDELVWSTCQDIKLKRAVGNAEAYSLALEYITSRGVGVGYASIDSIFELKEKFTDAWMRLYGDVHGQGAIPQVIGIVNNGNFGHDYGYINSVSSENDLISEQESYAASSEVFNDPIEKYTLAVSFTAGKRPHLGHLFLLSRAHSTAKSIDEPTEIKVEVNDTGERFDRLISAAREITGLTEDMIIEGINDGVFNIEQIEQWYTQRALDGDKSMYYVPPQIPTLRMFSQAEEILQSIRRLSGDMVVSGLLSSELNYENILSKADSRWNGTGYEVLQGRPLSKRGGATSLLTRLGFIDNLAETNNSIVYIDSSTEIVDAVKLSKKLLRNEMHNIKGAGVGFNFAIHSGSKARADLSIDAIADWYEHEVGNNNRDFMLDLNFLITRLPIHVPADQTEAYYNFKDLESFQELLIESRKSRLQLISVLENMRESMPLTESNTFTSGTPKALISEVNKILSNHARREVNEGVNRTHVRTYSPALIEDVNLLKSLHADRNLDSLKSQEDKIYQYLVNQLTLSNDIDSNTLRILQSEGYKTNQDLIFALKALQKNKHSLRYQFSHSQLLTDNAMKVIESVESISYKDSGDFYLFCDKVLLSLRGGLV